MFSKPNTAAPYFKRVIAQNPENMIQTFCFLLEVRDKGERVGWGKLEG